MMFDVERAMTFGLTGSCDVWPLSVFLAKYVRVFISVFLSFLFRSLCFFFTLLFYFCNSLISFSLCLSFLPPWSLSLHFFSSLSLSS